MGSLYRFSPIRSKEQLLAAIKYVSIQTTSLCKKITGQEYPVKSLTIFAHYPKEFEALKKIVLLMGTQFDDNNGPYINLNSPIKLPHNDLTQLRIRVPDPYRMQVGCNDFIISNYQKFKDTYLETSPNNLRLIKRTEYEMIEFFDPDFDVLAYILSN